MKALLIYSATIVFTIFNLDPFCDAIETSSSGIIRPQTDIPLDKISTKVRSTLGDFVYPPKDSDVEEAVLMSNLSGSGSRITKSTDVYPDRVPTQITLRPKYFNPFWKPEDIERGADFLPEDCKRPKGASIIEANTTHTATLIFFHGFADTGLSFDYVFDEIRPPFMKIICPHSWKVNITIAGGAAFPAWFDKTHSHRHVEEDTKGIKNSSSFLCSLIDEEVKRGIKPERIIVGGFAQGGVVAIHAALNYPKKIGGVIGVATWMPMLRAYSDTKNGLKPVHTGIPMLICHGTKDPIVEFYFGKLCAHTLSSIGQDVDLKLYPGGEHFIFYSEQDDFKEFINKHIPPLEDVEQ